MSKMGIVGHGRVPVSNAAAAIQMSLAGIGVPWRVKRQHRSGDWKMDSPPVTG